MHPGSRRSKGDRTSRRRPSARYELTINVSDNALLACVGGDFSGGSRPSGKEGGGHPDPEISGGGAVSPKKFFPPSGPQFSLEITGVPPDPSPGSATRFC